MLVFVVWIICMVVAIAVGTSKGHKGLAWALGILLGPLGLIIILLMPENEKAVVETGLQNGTMKICPFCAESIKVEAIVCKHCGNKLDTTKI